MSLQSRQNGIMGSSAVDPQVYNSLQWDGSGGAQRQGTWGALPAVECAALNFERDFCAREGFCFESNWKVSDSSSEIAFSRGSRQPLTHRTRGITTHGAGAKGTGASAAKKASGDSSSGLGIKGQRAALPHVSVGKSPSGSPGTMGQHKLNSLSGGYGTCKSVGAMQKRVARQRHGQMMNALRVAVAGVCLLPCSFMQNFRI